MRAFSIALILFLSASALHAESKDAFRTGNANPNRLLATSDAKDDLENYTAMSRRIGFLLGMMIPFGDVKNSFYSGPMLGLQYTWEAIPPFGFVVQMTHAAGSYKLNAGSGKFSDTALGVGAKTTFSTGRFVPYAELLGVLHFMTVSFDGTRIVTAGDDSNLSTVGIMFALGADIVVGREVSIGFQADLHYPVPKYINTSAGDFNLGSPLADVAFRLNF